MSRDYKETLEIEGPSVTCGGCRFRSALTGAWSVEDGRLVWRGRRRRAPRPGQARPARRYCFALLLPGAGLSGPGPGKELRDVPVDGRTADPEATGQWRRRCCPAGSASHERRGPAQRSSPAAAASASAGSRSTPGAPWRESGSRTTLCHADWPGKSKATRPAARGTGDGLGSAGGAGGWLSVPGDGVSAGVPVPGGDRGFGVLDELAVGGVVPGTGEQDRRAGVDAERGGDLIVGGYCGIFLVHPGRAADRSKKRGAGARSELDAIDDELAKLEPAVLGGYRAARDSDEDTFPGAAGCWGEGPPRQAALGLQRRRRPARRDTPSQALPGPGDDQLIWLAAVSRGLRLRWGYRVNGRIDESFASRHYLMLTTVRT